MTLRTPQSETSIPSPATEDISPTVDLEAVMDILRQTHPDLADEDILSLIRDVIEKSGR